MAKPHISGTVTFLVAPGCWQTGVHERVLETQVQGAYPRAGVHRRKPRLQEQGLGVVLGSECCMEKIVTVVKDGHLLHMGLSPRVFVQTGLTITLRSAHCDRAQFEWENS